MTFLFSFTYGRMGREYKGSSKIIIIFKRVGSTHSTMGEGFNGRCALFNDVDYYALYMHKSNFQSTLLGGRGHKKSTLCTLLIMLTIMDDP